MRLKSIQRVLRKANFLNIRSLIFITVFLVSLITIPLVSFSSQAASPTSKIEFVSPNWVAANANDKNLRILDVRNVPLDYIAGHIPQSVNIADIAFRGPNGFLPVQYWNQGKLQETFALSGVNNNSRVLVYSDGRDVLGATMVAYLLERSGVSDIAVLDGGYTGYKAAQPVIKEYTKYTKGNFKVQDNSSVRVTLNQVKQLIAKPGVTFIDPRPEKLFQGEENIWVRNGHIPGARNIPWPTFTDANNPHKLKSLDEIKQILASKKIDSNSDIIVSCSTGREATLQYVVLKHLLKYPKVRIYEGSWTEYSTTNLPVETGPEKIS